MAVQLVSAHVLIPHIPDWGGRVSANREWRVEVGRGLSGGEHRVAMRQRPRISLSWSLVPHNADEQAQMHARLRAAVKSGYGAVPYWGRGIEVSQASGDTIVLASDAWSFMEIGAYLLVRGLDVTAPESFEVVQVASVVNLREFNIAVDLTGDWSTGAWCWPLLFGAFSCGPLDHRSNWHTPLQCSLRTLASRPYIQPELCEYIYLSAAAGAADKFDCYPLGTVSSLYAGNGWAGPWVFSSHGYEDARDDMESYTETTGMNGGSGWSGEWVWENS